MEINKAELASAAAASGQAHEELMGAEILVRALQAEGVQHIWGYPGGAVLYIYDALYKQDTIQHVLVRHEQAAIHAADGYARATGEVGVAVVSGQRLCAPGRQPLARFRIAETMACVEGEIALVGRQYLQQHHLAAGAGQLLQKQGEVQVLQRLVDDQTHRALVGMGAQQDHAVVKARIG